jgi:SAM-dependent methyltransferase
MIARAPRGFQLAVADIARLPFAAAVFDVAVLAFMLFHAPDPRSALAEVRRVLIPGGTIGLTTWGTATPFTPDNVWAEELERHGAPPDVVASNRGLMDSPERLASLLDDGGFRAVTTRVEAFEQVMSVDGLMALRGSLGPTARRLAQLDSLSRADCLGHVRRRLDALDDAALTDHDQVISATAVAAG